MIELGHDGYTIEEVLCKFFSGFNGEIECKSGHSTFKVIIDDKFIRVSDQLTNFGVSRQVTTPAPDGYLLVKLGDRVSMWGVWFSTAYDRLPINYGNIEVTGITSELRSKFVKMLSDAKIDTTKLMTVDMMSESEMASLEKSGGSLMALPVPRSVFRSSSDDRYWSPYYISSLRPLWFKHLRQSSYIRISNAIDMVKEKRISVRMFVTYLIGNNLIDLDVWLFIKKQEVTVSNESEQLFQLSILQSSIQSSLTFHDNLKVSLLAILFSIIQSLTLKYFI